MDTPTTTYQPTHISLCSGYGGIDLGLKRCIPGLRTVAYSEIETAACELLLARMEGGSLDSAPIWTDLKSFPWRSFRGKVDILSGGYPCQPFSAAGKRAGKDDPRHLWPWIADGIAAMQPRLCFFENVEGHVTLGLRDVLQNLGALGYRATWGIFSAAECGASHQRKRVFILAYCNGTRLEGNITECARQENRCEPVRSTTGCSRSNGERDVANSMCDKSGESWFLQQRPDGPEPVSNGKSRRAWPSRPGEPQYAWEPPRVVGDAESGTRLGRASGDERHAAQSDEASIERQTQPSLGGDADGPAGGLDYGQLCVSCDNRTDELRMLGNGVVPATAERAFRTLIKELLQ